MAQDWYVGIGGKARRIVKAYIGVGGKAREIVAGYVGVGGKARQFWGGGEPKVKGVISAPRGYFDTGVGINSYALFGGATSSSYYNTYIDAYNKSLVRSDAQDRRNKGRYTASARAGNYGIFAGGTSGSPIDYADAYNDNLVRVSAPNLSRELSNLRGATAGTTAIIGYGKNSSIEYTNVTLYNANLVSTNTSYSSESRCIPSPLSFGQYAVFWGGADMSSDFDINNKSYAYDVWNASGVVKTGKSLKYGKSGVSTAVAGGKYAMFVGGSTSGSSGRTVVETLDTNLVQTQREDAPFSVYYGSDGNCGATIGNYAVFLVGNNNSTPLLYYDRNLVRVTEAIDAAIWDQFDEFPSATATVGRIGIFVARKKAFAIQA